MRDDFLYTLRVTISPLELYLKTLNTGEQEGYDGKNNMLIKSVGKMLQNIIF